MWLAGGGSVAYALLIAFLAGALHLLIKVFHGPGIPSCTTFAIYARSNILKILPGNVFHFVGRQAFAAECGVSQKSMAVVSLSEAILLCLAAGAVSVGLPDEALQLFSPWAALLYRATAFAAVAAIAGLVFMMLVSRRFSTHSVLLGVAFLFYIAFFIGTGMIFSVVGAALSDKGLLDQAASIVPAFAFVWIAGFLVPGASAGIGVREAIFVIILAPAIGESLALSVALIGRIATTLGDFLFYVEWLGVRRLARIFVDRNVSLLN